MTSSFGRNITGYPFEAAADLWTHVFQENMFSSVIRTAWPGWHNDAMHRSAIARKYSVDPMSMFYPWRYDNYYFCWALSRAWEHLLMATPEGGDLNDVEQKFTAYEKLHKRLAGEADPMAEVAFLQPRSSMDYATDGIESAMRPLHVWMQSALFSNIRGTILFEDDPFTEWQKYPCIVIAGATMLDDELLAKMKQYAENGGKLFIFGKFGAYRTDGTLREHPEAIFNFRADLNELAVGKEGVFNWKNHSIQLPAVPECHSLSNISGCAEVVAQALDGTIYGVSAMNGNVLWLAGGIKARQPEAMHYGLIVSKWGSDPDMELAAPAYVADYLRATPGNVLRTYLAETPQIACDSGKYLATCYQDTSDGKYYLHLVNTDNILARPPETVGHNYRFENFTENASCNGEDLLVTFRVPDDMTTIESVNAFSPEFNGEKILKCSAEGNVLKITIPAGTFAGYLGLTI
jgi:hypothetical protein